MSTLLGFPLPGIPGSRLDYAIARASDFDPGLHLAAAVNSDLAIVSDTLSDAIGPAGLMYVSPEC